MKSTIKTLIAALFVIGSINVAVANDDNYHGNKVKGEKTNPTTTAGTDGHTFDSDDYKGNKVKGEKTNPTITKNLDSHTFDNDN